MAISDTTMAGKICLVTGATAGIGEVTARELARRGATVVVVGRSQERCEATVEAIRRDTGNDAVEFLRADLSSQEEVRRLAKEFLDRHDRLDVLINNAGALFATRRESVDGIEMTFALNHLAYFLLTNLLLDTIKASAPARIVNIASDAHEMVKDFDFDDPQGRSRYRRLGADGQSKLAIARYTFLAPFAHPALVQYAQSKLANLLFTYELAGRLEGTGVTVNAVHPGFVATNFTAGNGLFGWFMRRWASLLAMSPENGAKTSIYLATSPEVDGVTGQYFAKQKPIASSPASRDESAARRLWQLSEELTGLSASRKDDAGDEHRGTRPGR
ncbi:MAG: dehydrogenase, short-chain alcohol dehydrogenase like protein [Planctomycetota bacterium]|nr:dehydrogenase, short-chain alcohol dehydrogenase like protein [Planctomycetota bacterium]